MYEDSISAATGEGSAQITRASQVASYTNDGVVEVGRNHLCQSLHASTGIKIPAETRKERVKSIQIIL